MKTAELQKMNDTDLAQHVSDKREELRKIRFGVAGSGMRNSHSIRTMRREIAQGLTELARRQKAA
jgi:ribosomal protein L29